MTPPRPGSGQRKTTKIVQRPGTAPARGPATPARGSAGAPPPPPKDDKTKLYIGLGAGGLLLVIIMAAAMSGGGEAKKSGPDLGAKFNKVYSRAIESHRAGNPSAALEILNEVLEDPKYRKLSRYKEASEWAASVRQAIQTEKDAVVKVDDFQKRIQKSKDEQTAMQKANEFYKECQQLIQEYGGTSKGNELRGIREDLRRWVATESQSDWQGDYNTVKARIQRDHLSQQDYARAVREWKKFGESGHDPLFHSRIEQELRAVNVQAKQAAEELVAAGGAALRASLEEALPRFTGTEGQDVINGKLKSLK